ncbi:hypothetical protein HPB51_024039 [Rhipicephalus microplus]|uniref:SHSP domain-containing protein n=1 Tax=Rhipicephalus microplus TaxID=6941 RepID=A0A9J6ED22_RHIMP|nr:alpha-crystallin A chain-like [Rhipicephalus microplus]XP_037272263.1 alpha-crystallin A chain-like [Rhipicephalus microplus]XP_037272264.1 alpha-crystallin A chain-like [Rhipicephalus microplus]XP_037272265.1 alpha-crystallin A chain-like [Rhipicephalus microplus]KAH8032262.1 hypothetical protein HPB51_024039 [Rhipicephalus microplus]
MSSLFTSRRLSDELDDLRSRLNDQYSRLDREYRCYENRYHDIRRRLFDGSPLKPSVWTSLTNDSERFCLRLDVGHFDCDDLEVKTVDNQVVIHGKHGDRTDELGVISREFTRKCTLPKDVQPDAVKCSITSDGFLIIEAPKRSDKPHGQERVVPITVVDGSTNGATTGTDHEASAPGPSGKKTTTTTTTSSGGTAGTESRTSSSTHTVTTTSSKSSFLKNGTGPGVSTGAISKVM